LSAENSNVKHCRSASGLMLPVEPYKCNRLVVPVRAEVPPQKQRGAASDKDILMKENIKCLSTRAPPLDLNFSQLNPVFHNDSFHIRFSIILRRASGFSIQGSVTSGSSYMFLISRKTVRGGIHNFWDWCRTLYRSCSSAMQR
jgi:hypothetical protein